MKKILTWLFILGITLPATAQQWGGSATTTGLLYRDGNVVVGSNVLYGSWANDRVLQVIGNNSALALFSNAYSGNYILGFFPQYNYSGIISAAHPLVMSVGGGERMRIATSGAISVGSVPSTPAGYKLFVEQGILTEKVKVAIKTTGDWSDHVFHKDYPLMSLSQVEQFIKTNGHLPNIPSAEDVAKNGIDLGKMDAKLLEKIEELTLYILSQHKQNEEQQKEIEQLKAEIQKIVAKNKFHPAKNQ